MDIGTSYTDMTYFSENHEEVGNVVENPYVDMVNDAFNFNVGFDDNYHQDSYHQDSSYQNVEEPVRNHSKKFYDLLEEFLPEGNQATSSHYQTEKLMRNLGLPYHTIDVCSNNCMLFWKEDEQEDHCRFCGAQRWKPKDDRRRTKVPYSRMWYLPIGDRLKRMYQSHKTAAAMRWHAEHQSKEGEMNHPSDAAEWRYFQELHPRFAEEPRNVYLGLCTDGFNPFGMSRNHSLWPVILTPYNLPPSMCMNTKYLFLTILNVEPNHPRASLDVFLQPLIEELKELWSTGVDAYDVSLSQNFNLKAVLLWTISDFPAYSMLSGWITHGKFSCPICMESTKSFYLPNGRKTCWFDCHRRFLPHGHPSRRNKKDFLKGRDSSSEYPPKSLTGEQVYYERLASVNPTKTKDVGGNGHEKKMPGYGKEHNWHKESILWELSYWNDLNLRHNIDVMHTEKNFLDDIMNTLMSVKDKSKDNIMSRLDIEIFCSRSDLHIDSQGIGAFFRDLCSRTLQKSRVQILKQNIVLIICNLEKIFPPSFFDVMEHLPIHLPYEPELGGPVQYRWMYPFERFFKKFKGKAKNKRYAAGSIVESYINDEIAYFSEYYFADHIQTKSR
ncbi:putative transposon protein [Arabidopsis thaliana]|uniref:Putative transposon protein n=1 Tax=Arabidopsis thaliana TaxID=3702 RepID=Q9ZQB5_ARATH|nr:putative transposon protein [Arabidopsis thaliana]CAB77951.1 putative transposon protein [Arabidopsis thaliana]